jgi:hypothetical protein
MKVLMLLALLTITSCVTLSPAERQKEIRDARIHHEKY